jgi:hypothetical protein
MENGCPVCLCEHDETIHQATLSLHGWIRWRVTRWFEDDIELDDDPTEYFLIEPTAA